MTTELAALLSSVPANAVRADYARAIIDDNVLGKKTGSNRRLTAQRLSELYGLDASIPVYRLLRYFWDIDPVGRLLSAFLCAFARDPLLRITASAVLPTPAGAIVRTIDLEHAIAAGAPGRLNSSIQNKAASNAGSSWTQSGHLTGRQKKTRVQAMSTPASTAYALLLGYVEGARGAMLFETVWARILDRPKDEIINLAIAASQRGWLQMLRAGDIVDIKFTDILTPKERNLLDEQG
ncbi:MAG: hypothetical protein NTY46_11755 [Candidatus Sumerlaeota bacterium]|nr:hypothetical protein [Candidatus Sumerlaeota bacterium]